MITGQILTPSGQYVTDLREARGMKFGTISPGGCYTASWTQEVPYPYIGVQMPEEDLLLNLYDDGTLIQQYIVGTIGVKARARSATWSITAVGYSTLFNDVTIDAAFGLFGGYSIEQIFKLVRNTYVPEVSTQDRLIATTGRTIQVTPVSYVNKSAIDVFSDMTKLGDSAGNALVWHVWAGDPAGDGKPILELRSKAQTPLYQVNISEGAEVDVQRNRNDQASRIKVTYTFSGQPASVTATSALAERPWPSGRGRSKTLTVPVPNIASAADATNVANTLLNEVLLRRARGNSIQIPAGTPIRGASGGIVMPQSVRAGDVIQVGDLKAAANYGYESQFYIAQTQYDVDSGALSITPEGPDDLTSRVARLPRI